MAAAVQLLQLAAFLAAVALTEKWPQMYVILRGLQPVVGCIIMAAIKLLAGNLIWHHIVKFFVARR